MFLFQDGDTALMMACMEGHTEVADMLIKKNASVDATDEVSKCFLAFLLKNRMTMLILTDVHALLHRLNPEVWHDGIDVGLHARTSLGDSPPIEKWCLRWCCGQGRNCVDVNKYCK
jgi:ankyrin repeat protein